MNCPGCGRDVDASAEHNFCSFCGSRLSERESDQDQAGAEQAFGSQATGADQNRIRYLAGHGYCPWEDQENLGFAGAMSATLRQSLFGPHRFFESVPAGGGLLLPLLYSLIVGTLGAMAATLWGLTLENPLLLALGGSGNFAILMGVLIPVAVLIGILFSSVAVHVSLMLAGGAREDFEATFRVICYASAPELFSAIPLIGGPVGLVWKIYLTFVGIRAVHETTTVRAAAAVLIPMVVLCGMLSMGFALLPGRGGLD